jgi:iron complex transport system ATP-binding protein
VPGRLLAPDAAARFDAGWRAALRPAAAQRARAIGYLPQTAEVAWDMSVETLVALGRLPWGDTAAEAG